MTTDELAKRVYAKAHGDLDRALAEWLSAKSNDQQLVQSLQDLGHWLVKHLAGAKV